MFLLGGFIGPAPYPMTDQVWRYRDGTWVRVGRGNVHVAGAGPWQLRVFDDGAGAALYATGTWETMEGVMSPGIARWNGVQWEGVGTGLGLDQYLQSGAMAVVDEDGPGPNQPGLYVGGQFVTAGGNISTALARWGCRPRYPGDVNCDGHNTFADIDPFVTALGGAAAYAEHFPLCNWLNADCDDDGQVTFADIDPFVGLLGN